VTSARLAEGWDAAFEGSPFRLRFELGGEVHGSDEPAPRFIQALGRARQIASDLFEGTPHLHGIVGCWTDSARDLFAPAEDGFAALEAVGFRSQSIAEWRTPADPGDDGYDAECVWRAFDLTGRQADRDVLLWCAVAYEIGIEPKAPIQSYLVDFARGVLLHVYDDRGIDVTALEPEPLLDLHRSRDAWLLDHDRPRMQAAFGR
jgi:hypothetical protein